MKKRWLVLPCCFLYSMVSAQSVQEVVNAERSFAQHALSHSIKQAFLQYLDSNGVVFTEGGVQNGLRFWEKAHETEARLQWYPTYAAIAAAGDLGFTTGPFEFRQTLAGPLLGSGRYTTVWRKTEKGEWKFLVDLGVDLQPSLYDDQTPLTLFTPAGAADTSVQELELQLIRRYDSLSVTAFRDVITEASLFNIRGQVPKKGVQPIMQGLQGLPVKYEFIPVATGISQSKDLAYAYGIMRYNGKRTNYLRIWAHTAEGWKVLVQVLPW